MLQPPPPSTPKGALHIRLVAAAAARSNCVQRPPLSPPPPGPDAPGLPQWCQISLSVIVRITT